MKTVFSILICLMTVLGLRAQDNGYLFEIEKHRAKENADFKNPERSPLNEKDRKAFKGHEYYPVDPDYKVIADFVATPGAKPFPLVTSKGTTKNYKKLGDLNFKLKGEALSLEVYQQLMGFVATDEPGYLFLPIIDKTTGVTTYDAGRYMHYEGMPEGTEWVIDFNKAYNPFCAYSDNYSCPVVPQPNHLPVAIAAGIRGGYKK
jgi:uncharacterized protein (DUF1684 family)